MSVNFFGTECTEPSKTDELFGICDDQDGEKAYSDTTDKNKWIAVVKNSKGLAASFTAIDHCIIILKEGTKDEESTCDGMITFTDSLYQLKKQGTGGWVSKAIAQLENTIKLLIAHHDLKAFKYKKAFACNKKHPRFRSIDNEQNKRLFVTYGFRLDVQAEIVIK
ncbi:MAG: hypothetical protein H6560_09440 [Lewinellaceae bacterium]|nr:hypothetical protein [Lewinellaceae bacterium]